MKSLISRQYVMIDSHNCGCEPTLEGIHLHKKSKEHSEDVYEIRIPLQTDREVSVNCIVGVGHVPSKIKKEVKKVLNNKQKRTEFFNEIFENLKKYNWVVNAEDEIVLVNRIAKVFGLKKTDYDRKSTPSSSSYIMTDGESKFEIVLDYETQRVYIGELMDDWKPELNF